ncbi:DEAD/DEAH box helicase [Rossellomorea aquimaris]|uniref:DEAD/DEAH box helicase n=1 Tax=Rossellomorea aquimaris TaxID=189382 RepID=UPI0007D05F84|nr:DEAD/DEAH box helicase [Rossellomorea aquimaris]
MCGTVSFKKGESYYRSNKVVFKEYGSLGCEASVLGTEEFHVKIEKGKQGDIHTNCSCPSLASFDRDCQHIAAVLLAVYDQQRNGLDPSGPTNMLTEGLFNLFDDQKNRSSGHQLHFENREVLEAEFICTPVTVEKDQQILGIKVKIGSVKVQDIRSFLVEVKKGNPYSLSNSFTFQQNLHCFQQEPHAVMEELVQVLHDEEVYGTHLRDNSDLLLIPPTSWERVMPLLRKAKVKVEYDGKQVEEIQVSEKKLPLQFDFTEAEKGGYQLKVKGLKDVLVLESYRFVLYNGVFFSLEQEDCQRLTQLQKMLTASGTDRIPVSQDQIGLFLDKVAHGLKKLGEVHLSETVAKQFMKTPLVAKLYLDRVKNRLLAGLEFHYGNYVLNPQEENQLPANTPVIRDVEKEQEILQLMKDSSFAETESGYFLHNEELEYEFLYYVVPKLQKLVQMYATTAVRNRIFRKNSHPKVRVKVKRERTNWLEFKFEMDGINDHDIREILGALEEKRKYYRMKNGALLSLETREFQDIHRFLQSPQVQNGDLGSELVLPLNQSLQLLDTVEGGNIFELEKSFREFFDHLQNPDQLDFPVPESLESILRDYQKQGYKWMKTLAYYGFGGILADDMGLGKTLQSIAYILSELPSIRQNRLPVLVVCPSSLTYNWLNELMKFAPNIEAVVLDGNKTERVNLQKEIEGVDVLITSYPLLRKDIHWYEKQSFHTVFFDEAQAFKNPITQTARAVKKLKADHSFALSGTPVENSIEELWSIFHVVFPELFLGLKEYSKLTRKTISKRIRPFMLRRLKEDVLADLPEKMEMLETVELLPSQKQLYAAYLAKLKHDTLKHLDKQTLSKNRIKILAGLTRLRQICCHPSLFVDGYQGSSAKFEQLMRIIRESKLSGRRVLVFSQFTKMLEIISRELSMEGHGFLYLDGQTPSEERVEICQRFNSGERDIFLISLKAGGTGLNLTSADTVILYDTWWNPAVEEQAADRAHRMGQKNVVQVIKLVTHGTIEEKMNDLQDRKRQLVEEIIDPKEKGGSTLTEEDLREILMI